MYITAVSLLVHTNCCKSVLEDPDTRKPTQGSRLFGCAILVDAFLTITALVIGILGVVGIIPGIPAAASFALFALSGIIILTWINMVMISGTDALKMAKVFLKTTFSTDLQATLDEMNAGDQR